jgi:hypothetical protein
MDKEVHDYKLIFEFLNNFIVVKSLMFCFFDKYFLELIGLKLKVLTIENILPKMIQSKLMKIIPFSPTKIIILAMVKVIVVEFKDNKGGEVSFRERLERNDVVLLYVNLFQEGTVEPWELFDAVEVAFVDDYFGKVGKVYWCQVS